MSLPNYQNWKNKKLYMEMQAGAASPRQPYIPSSERNVVGNQLRTPEPTHQTKFPDENETAPSLNSGGPEGSDWYRNIVDRFKKDVHKPAPAPERNASLGDLGMQGVSDATFGKADGATPPGDTPLVSGGVPVTDMKGQFDWNVNENNMEPPTGINPAGDPPEDPNLPGQASMYVDKILKILAQKNGKVIQDVKQHLMTQLTQLQQQKMGAGANRFGRMDMQAARGAMKNPVGQT